MYKLNVFMISIFEEITNDFSITWVSPFGR